MNSEAVDELERQIEDTRHALDRTLRALQFELSPAHQAQVAWHRVKQRTESSFHAGADWAVANRVPVLVGAVAVIAACTVPRLLRRRALRVFG